MTREQLIQAIYDNNDEWSCPNYNCEKIDCMTCTKLLLAEYENGIRTDAINVLLTYANDKSIDTEVGKFIHLNELRLIVEQMGEQMGGDKDE